MAQRISVLLVCAASLIACGARADGRNSSTAPARPDVSLCEPGNASSCDAAAGAAVFEICATCHSLEPGRHEAGPSLAGLVGRKSGTEPGFRYSAAMSRAGIVWSDENLDSFLLNPQSDVPGNYMPFGGLKDAQARRDLICYLISLQ